MPRGASRRTRSGRSKRPATRATLRDRPSPRRASSCDALCNATRHSAILVAVIASLIAVAPVGAQEVEPQASLPDIEDEVMCPVCGTLLELAAEAPQAERERAFIRELIAEGLTKDQIKDALVAEFGDEVLATPDTEGFDLAAWLVPVLAFLGGAVAIGVGLRRWRRAGAAAGGEEAQGDGTAEPLDSDESKKLDADLARYRL